ncbi:MAG: hypothetical protein QOJ64_2580 [Acidobacteriota bacterium]|jgi:predicted MFS family arabinose efflux permease|nr:hypothetical protein [Acidobacteriota bacterium]
MKELKLKHEFSGGLRTRPAEIATSFLVSDRQSLNYPNERRKAAALAEVMFQLEKLVGAILGGTAVTVILGNMLICLSLLLLGPAFILELLARIHGLNP